MPYLSRIWLNPLRTGTRRLLRNPEAMHAAVLGGITAQPVTERTLWRTDFPDAHRVELLVLTQSTPSWEHLIEQAGWANADEPQVAVRDYAPLLQRLVTGREFRFRLVANPVTATRAPLAPTTAQAARLATARPRGVRVAARTAAHQVAWVCAKAPSWGFELPAASDGTPAVKLIGREELRFSKDDRGHRNRLTLTTATFDGLLRVVDSEAARRSVLQGVGAARAYGCGLLTLAPSRSE